MAVHSLSPETKSQQTGTFAGSLSLSEYSEWILEVMNQPPWRSKADREMDYVDGNQLDAEILQKQAQLGIPPAIEPLIGPAVDAVLGFEAKTRTDWRLIPDGDKSGEKVAKALNFKLNQAERQAGADNACSDAFKTQVCVGLGWVEVSKETNPFKFPYRCKAVHRNEIFWDFLSKEPDLSDARYLVRRRWTDVPQAALKFPDKAALIKTVGSTGSWADQFTYDADGGQSTDLAMAYMDERGFSIEEQEWRDCIKGRVCLFEVWYRRWEEVVVIRLLDGRVVEYDQANPVHTVAVAAGVAKPSRAVVPRMYLSYWMGPHKLYEGRSPYRHADFPYVAFWGKREDRTGVPYGCVRGMVYLQDSVNSAISKIRWGLSAVRTERTKGAVDMTDAQFRQQIARPDADVILDADHMAKPGARFEVKRDFQLNEQQYKMLGDARLGIQRASGITASFQGQTGTARSGVQESTQIEQTTQQLADMMDNFRRSRTKVGDLLLSLIIEDTIGKQNERVFVRSNNATIQDEEVTLNVPQVDEVTGLSYMDNNVERIRLKCVLSDVPTTPSFRHQQLQAMSEAFKSMPPEYQAVALPHLLYLMDLPDKEEIIKAIQESQGKESPEQIQARIDEAVQKALDHAQFELKNRELDLKYNPEKERAAIRQMVAQTVLTSVQSAFAAMQAGGQLAMNPAIAPVADAILQAGGYTPPDPAGVDPNFDHLPIAQGSLPQPGVDGDVPLEGMQFDHNTSPGFPDPAQTGMHGIETMSTADNQPEGVN
jgi:hypothetical protein